MPSLRTTVRNLILTTIGFIFIGSPAFAQQSLIFKEPETRREKQALLLNDNKGFIAKADLNNDLIDDYVIQHCTGQKMCDYKIIAFKAFNPILIGTFKAHKIVVDDEKTYGIHNFIVYNQAYNDFAFTTAIWNPFSFSFEIQ